MDKRPIGLFDSGLGGVSTLIQARDALPRENFVYYGDHGNAPYGSRGDEDLRELALKGTRVLVEKHGVKAVVLACNTATAAAYELLVEELPVPVIGSEPAILHAADLQSADLQPADLQSADLQSVDLQSADPQPGLILMMATEATVRLPRYRRLREKLKEPRRVKDVPCPTEIVRRVEKGLFTPGSYDDVLEHVLHAFEGERVDAIVLGCTHYPFIMEEIRAYGAKHFRGELRFFDGGKDTIAALQALLHEQSIENTEGMGHMEFYTSGDKKSIQPLFEQLLQKQLQI